jgi:rubredoxin
MSDDETPSFSFSLRCRIPTTTKSEFASHTIGNGHLTILVTCSADPNSSETLTFTVSALELTKPMTVEINIHLLNESSPTLADASQTTVTFTSLAAVTQVRFPRPLSHYRSSGFTDKSGILVADVTVQTCDTGTEMESIFATTNFASLFERCRRRQQGNNWLCPSCQSGRDMLHELDAAVPLPHSRVPAHCLCDPDNGF